MSSCQQNTVPVAACMAVRATHPCAFCQMPWLTNSLNLGFILFAVYRVDHLLANLGWVDLDLECSNVLLGQ